MDEAKKLFKAYSNLMNSHIKGVEIGCSSVALLALTIAIRRVRPFSRFKRPSDIPNRFIKERCELVGTVERIDPNGGLLMIEHKPLIAVPGVKKGSLPVKVAGVNVTSLGVNWLQAIVVGSEVKFIPVLKNKDYLQCEVVLPQITLENKPRLVNIGESLVSIGFGSLTGVEKSLLGANPVTLAYYERLKAAEKLALKKKMGIKYYVGPTKLIMAAIAERINQSIKSLAKPPPPTKSKSNKLVVTS